MEKFEELVFLQVEYEGLPAGTPLVKAEKSSAHYHASAAVGTQIPTGYYKLAGTEGPATLALPLFEKLVGYKHPTDPRVVGPFVCTGFSHMEEDRLPAGYAAYITVQYDHPYARFVVCANTTPGGKKVRVELPAQKVINYREEVEKYLSGKELEAEYTDAW